MLAAAQNRGEAARSCSSKIPTHDAQSAPGLPSVVSAARSEAHSEFFRSSAAVRRHAHGDVGQVGVRVGDVGLRFANAPGLCVTDVQVGARRPRPRRRSRRRRRRSAPLLRRPPCRPHGPRCRPPGLARAPARLPEDLAARPRAEPPQVELDAPARDQEQRRGTQEAARMHGRAFLFPPGLLEDRRLRPREGGEPASARRRRRRSGRPVA